MCVDDCVCYLTTSSWLRQKVVVYYYVKYTKKRKNVFFKVVSGHILENEQKFVVVSVVIVFAVNIS